jgi:hypothetical protein
MRSKVSFRRYFTAERDYLGFYLRAVHACVGAAAAARAGVAVSAGVVVCAVSVAGVVVAVVAVAGSAAVAAGPRLPVAKNAFTGAMAVATFPSRAATGLSIE